MACLFFQKKNKLDTMTKAANKPKSVTAIQSYGENDSSENRTISKDGSTKIKCYKSVHLHIQDIF